MSYKLIILQRAHKELMASWTWYEDQQPGLGDRFMAVVFNKLRLIEQNPERYPKRVGYYREAGVAVFPYLIIYRVNKLKKTIAVSSIFHTRRNPRRKIRR